MQMTEKERALVARLMDEKFQDALKATAALREHYKHNPPNDGAAMELYAQKRIAARAYAVLETTLHYLGWTPVNEKGHVTGLTPFAPKPYVVRFPFRGVKDRIFESESAVREWIMDGLRGCEGAEQEHYTNLLLQVEAGQTELNY